MKKEYSTLEELIKKNLSTDEEINTSILLKKLKGVKKRGYFTKDEFVKMGCWKSSRPRKHYFNNSEKDVISVSRQVLKSKNEEEKINLLTTLNGVSVAVASAILMLTDPKNYGVLDIRVWQVLYLYGSVTEKEKGANLDSTNWYDFIEIIRYYAKKHKVSARDVERTIFIHHKKIQEGKLYKYS